VRASARAELDPTDFGIRDAAEFHGLGMIRLTRNESLVHPIEQLNAMRSIAAVPITRLS
jgi:hypothetical protein